MICLLGYIINKYWRFVKAMETLQTLIKTKKLQSDSMSFSRLKCDQKVTLRGLNVIVMSVIYCKQEHISPRFNFDPFALVVIG